MIKIYTNGLTDSINLLKNRFIVVQELTSDVDVILHNPSGCSYSTEHFGVMGDVMDALVLAPHKRIDKLYQNIILDNIGIYTPKSYFDRYLLKPLRGIGEIDAHCSHLKEFVTKPLLGAKGWGVRKMTRDQLVEAVYGTTEGHKIKSEKFEPECSEKLRYERENLRDFDFIIQEPIDIKREFRMILTPYQNLIYERQITETSDGLPKANITEGFEVKGSLDYDRPKMRHIIDKLRSGVIERYKYPFLSVDVFVDSDGNYGVMEFQMEFAYEGFKGQLPRLIEILCDSVEKLYNEHRFGTNTEDIIEKIS